MGRKATGSRLHHGSIAIATAIFPRAVDIEELMRSGR
jgi:hypothetical protein